MGFGLFDSTLASGELGCVWYDGSFHQLSTGVSSFTDGDIHSVTFVFDDDNNSQELYYDGERVASSTVSGSVVYSSVRDASIGAADFSRTRGESGVYINLSAYWERPLSSGEVKALHDDPFIMLRPAGF
jgi:hypothetical protein